MAVCGVNTQLLYGILFHTFCNQEIFDACNESSACVWTVSYAGGVVIRFIPKLQPQHFTLMHCTQLRHRLVRCDIHLLDFRFVLACRFPCSARCALQLSCFPLMPRFEVLQGKLWRRFWCRFFFGLFRVLIGQYCCCDTLARLCQPTLDHACNTIESIHPI
jgi:hypothetical protein